MSSFLQRRAPVTPDRVRKIPRSFSWFDRDLLHHRHLGHLSLEEFALYSFLVLVAGPEGTSFWSPGRIAELLHLEVDEVIVAVRGLIRRDLIAFRYPTFQVLSLPARTTER